MNPNSNQKIQFPKEMGSTTEFQKLALQRLTIPIKSAQDLVKAFLKNVILKVKRFSNRRSGCELQRGA